MIKPNLNILPKPQKLIWPKLVSMPKSFILYGGTAIALQLGHRQSVDFDFFSALPLDRNSLLNQLEFLKTAKLVQPEINTLDCFVQIDDSFIKIQFLAGLKNRLGRVQPVQICEGNQLQIASLLDLLGTKLQTIQSRAEIKDYLDIDAIITHGISLERGLACSQAIFGEQFDPSTSLRALTSFRDGNLSELPKIIKNRLTRAAINVDKIPQISKISDTI